MKTVEELPPAELNRLTSGGLHLQGKPAAECRRLVEESLEAIGPKERLRSSSKRRSGGRKLGERSASKPQGSAKGERHAYRVADLVEAVAGLEWRIDGDLGCADPHAVAYCRSEKLAIGHRARQHAFAACTDAAFLRTEYELRSRTDVGFRRNWEGNALSNDVGALRSRAHELALQDVGSPEKRRHEQIGGALVKLHRRADLLHCSVIHYGDAVADRVRLLLVVGHEDRRQAEPLLQITQLAPHLHAQLGVEVRQRLVEQEHLGPNRNRPRQRDPLLLAAGELRRTPIGEAGEPYQLQSLGDALLYLLARQAAFLQPKSDIAPNGHVRPQG